MMATKKSLTLCGIGALLALTVASLPLGRAASAEEKAEAADDWKKPVPGDLLLGEWWTENNEGRIRMARYRDGTYRGTTTCCRIKDDKNNANIDIHNPKPELRHRSTIGIVLIWNLRYEDGEYVDGHVYNPRDGKTYRMKMVVVDRETLKVRGYMGIPLLGQTQIWKRARPDAKKPATAAAR